MLLCGCTLQEKGILWDFKAVVFQECLSTAFPSEVPLIKSIGIFVDWVLGGELLFSSFPTVYLPLMQFMLPASIMYVMPLDLLALRHFMPSPSPLGTSH